MHPLESRLNYTFQSQALLLQALRHPSAGAPHYERLEFLGDRVLGLMIADWLLNRTLTSEGLMAQDLAELTSKHHLSRVAHYCDIKPHIQAQLGPGRHYSENILSDVMESLMGAVFLDSDYTHCKRTFLPLLTHDTLWHRGERHAKNELQEWTQKQQLPLPQYTLLSSDKGFTVACQVIGFPPTQGWGLQKRSAELEAAEAMLHLIGVKL